MKQGIITINLISAAVAAAAGILLWVFLGELESAIIAGLLAGALSHQMQLHRLALAWRSEAAGAAERQGRRLIKVLDEHHRGLTQRLTLHEDYYQDNWLHQILEEIVTLRKSVEQQAWEKRRVEATLSDSLLQIKRSVGSRYTIHTGLHDEIHRVKLLRDAVEDAQHYVYAVTFDANEYFDNFWDAAFGPQYIRTNINTARRGVPVDRIFVFEDKMLRGSQESLPTADRKKLNEVNLVIKKLMAAEPNMTLRVVSKERLERALPGSDVSFLVCDDAVASESTGFSESEKIDGYISYNDKETVTRLKERFEKMKFLSRKIEEPPE